LESYKIIKLNSSQLGGIFSFSKNKIKRILFITYFFFILFSTYAQSNINTDKGKKIQILNANSLEYDESSGKKAKKLIGDVKLQHENFMMFCDSALIFSQLNTMEAYGNVKIEQGDSLHLFGDSLKYDGNTKIAHLRGNIKLINNDIILTTTFLDYNRNLSEAYYYNGGEILSKENNDTLMSTKGYYFTQETSFYFKDNVILKNKDYNITTDTLKYNSTTGNTYFLGPSTITSNENLIYTTNGWYNTKTNVSEFYTPSYLYTNKKIIKGDTLFYDRNKGFGKITCNATINDTSENIIIGGDKALLFEKTDSAMITDEALLMQIDSSDTLYLHADTFKISTQIINVFDSLKTDSLQIKKDTLRTLFAYNHVKFYKSDMQGKADSVIYNFADSTINFYTKPIIWSKENQLTADFMYLQLANKKVKSIHLQQNAFIISKVDTVTNYFNQIKGKLITGFFKNDSLYKITVNQNAETIYFPLDDFGKYIGVNKATGNNMLIFIGDKKIKSLTFIKDPEGTLYPLNQPSPKDLILKGFHWSIYQKPKNYFDIFVW